MRIEQFDYNLPAELIAQTPVEPRDASRLLVLNRKNGAIEEARFNEIGKWLMPGDLLVFNDTRVIPARIFGRLLSGGKMEFLLLRKMQSGVWEVLTRPARKARIGTVVDFDGFRAEIIERKPDGIRLVRFEPEPINQLLETRGEVALPPYIKQKYPDPERYQTIFARVPGAVAAPTAGLHFTPELVKSLCAKGLQVAVITLHASLGTFRPVKVSEVEKHRMHPEEFEISEEAAARINQALKEQRRVVCVGTTTVRVLESQAVRDGDKVQVKPGKGETDLYIYPGFEWKVTGALITNFHLPKSTLLLLVSAFASREMIMKAYEYAIAHRFRFYSFGDAMLII
ncbi:MAG: tRNA preQ1(34) S-adenosylmethionine ribosyltransferase-isomerase QueA [candidate division WOR-3 bacterium]|jgi:S-adenosylmethionine:tRNA ribosyltransferase-isomerase|nr:tRNA preQ1(34) S-adenosylmethionine ribosyltransferase-isomerase QueA [candidate division WOR-3 bacterium]MCR4423315.1 tRNA preQ1(34) S-adenosylmethionine ribosyltransferase-isomerase QueA [candidate division WOR-3 bacterium]MDH7518654.1 tRNA preQ1(34) S-adenosylmethionine ribosyltransferase-isomerase QueA [bacterium]